MTPPWPSKNAFLYWHRQTVILFSAVPELKVCFSPQVWYEVCTEPVQPSSWFRRGSNGTGLGLLLARTIQVISSNGGGYSKLEGQSSDRARSHLELEVIPVLLLFSRWCHYVSHWRWPVTLLPFLEFSPHGRNALGLFLPPPWISFYPIIPTSS